MASVPLTWTFKTEGGEHVKQTLDQLSDAFDKAKASGAGFGKEQRNIKTAVRDTLGQQRFQNNLLLAQHPNLLRVSRGLSTVTSITRTLLTISNALNLSKIANQGLDANTISINNDVAAAKRKLMELDKAGAKGTDEWYEATEALNLALGRQKENSQALIDQKWEGLATGVLSAISVISTTFNLLIKNGTILKALTSAGSYFGSVFSGFFTLASTAINKITTWLFPPTVVSKAAIVSSGAGTITGTAFGAAFQIAAIAGLVIAIAAMFDFLIEQITGWSFVKEIQKAFGIKDAKSVGGMVGYQSPAAVPWTGVNDYDNYIKDSGFAKSKNKGVLPSTSSSSTLNDSVSKSIKESFTPLVSSINGTDINFKNLNTGLITNSTHTSAGNQILSDYTNYVKEFNPGDKSAREEMKNKTMILSDDIATNSAYTGLNITSTNLLITSNNTLTDATNSLASSFKSSGGGSSGGGTSGGATSASQYRAIMQSPTKRATGFEGMVNTPQLMMVGDAGPEYVSVTPHGGTRSGGGTTIIVNIAGSVVTEKQLFSRLDDIQKNNLKRRGFTGT